MAVFKWRGISYKNFFEEKDNYISGRYHKAGEFVITYFKVIISKFQDFLLNCLNLPNEAKLSRNVKKLLGANN